MITISSPVPDTTLYSDKVFVEYIVDENSRFTSRVVIEVDGVKYERDTLKGTVEVTGLSAGNHIIRAYLINRSGQIIVGSETKLGFTSIIQTIPYVKELSIVAPTQLPEFVRNDYTKFANFIRAYYEFLEQSNDPKLVPLASKSFLDVDETPDVLLERFRKEFIPDFPEKLTVDEETGKPLNLRNLIKRAKQFYETKGTENSIAFLFRVLFDADITIFYPRTNILEVSGGKWTEKKSIKIFAKDFKKTSALIGNVVYQTDAARNLVAKGTVVEVQNYRLDSYRVSELSLKDITGTFRSDLALQCDLVYEGAKERFSFKIYRGASVVVENGGYNYQVGDKILLQAANSGQTLELGISSMAWGAPFASSQNTVFLGWGKEEISKANVQTRAPHFFENLPGTPRYPTNANIDYLFGSDSACDDYGCVLLPARQVYESDVFNNLKVKKKLYIGDEYLTYNEFTYPNPSYTITNHTVATDYLGNISVPWLTIDIPNTIKNIKRCVGWYDNNPDELVGVLNIFEDLPKLPGIGDPAGSLAYPMMEKYALMLAGVISEADLLHDTTYVNYKARMERAVSQIIALLDAIKADDVLGQFDWGYYFSGAGFLPLKNITKYSTSTGFSTAFNANGKTVYRSGFVTVAGTIAYPDDIPSDAIPSYNLEIFPGLTEKLVTNGKDLVDYGYDFTNDKWLNQSNKGLLAYQTTFFADLLSAVDFFETGFYSYRMTYDPKTLDITQRDYTNSLFWNVLIALNGVNNHYSSIGQTKPIDMVITPDRFGQSGAAADIGRTRIAYEQLFQDNIDPAQFAIQAGLRIDRISIWHTPNPELYYARIDNTNTAASTEEARDLFRYSFLEAYPGYISPYLIDKNNNPDLLELGYSNVFDVNGNIRWNTPQTLDLLSRLINDNNINLLATISNLFESRLGKGYVGTVSKVDEKGTILKIDTVNFGFSYELNASDLYTPVIESTHGVGFSGAVSSVVQCNYPGYFAGNSGLLNSLKVIQDSFYHQTHSYEIQSGLPFSRYKDALKRIVHPAGFEVFGKQLVGIDFTNPTTLHFSVKISPSNFIGNYIGFTIDAKIDPRGTNGGTDLFPHGFNPSLPSPPLQNPGETPHDSGGDPIDTDITGGKYGPLTTLPDVDDIDSIEMFWIVFPHPNAPLNNGKSLKDFTIGDFVLGENQQNLGDSI